jgi:uncharacterized membrane protein YqjE
MNEIPGMNPVIPPVDSSIPPPANWRTALADLLGARISLFQLEAKEATGIFVKKAIFFAAAAILLLLGWVIFVAAIVGAISDKGDFAWYWVALIAAGIHLLIAGILVQLARRPAPPAFQILAAEFKKDREWLHHFQTPKKSNN